MKYICERRTELCTAFTKLHVQFLLPLHTHVNSLPVQTPRRRTILFFLSSIKTTCARHPRGLANEQGISLGLDSCTFVCFECLNVPPSFSRCLNNRLYQDMFSRMSANLAKLFSFSFFETVAVHLFPSRRLSRELSRFNLLRFQKGVLWFCRPTE